MQTRRSVALVAVLLAAALSPAAAAPAQSEAKQELVQPLPPMAVPADSLEAIAVSVRAFELPAVASLTVDSTAVFLAERGTRPSSARASRMSITANHRHTRQREHWRNRRGERTTKDPARFTRRLQV